MTNIQRATVLAPGKIRHLLNVTEATSRHPERDADILLLGLSCGMRCTETAQITVADLLFPSGILRTEVSLRAKITKGCKQRCIYISSPKLIAALERYLTFRVENRIKREMRALGMQLGGYEIGGFMRIVSSYGVAHYERIFARKRQQNAEVRH